MHSDSSLLTFGTHFLAESTYHFPPAIDTRVHRFLHPLVLFRLNYQPSVATDQPHLCERNNMFGNVKTLRELFEIELRYAYDAEKTLV